MELAYAITVHKAQGSEYDNVAIVLPEYYPSLLEKSLFYTAITRGKKNVTVYMKNNEVLNQTILNDKRKNRKTLLYEMLKTP